MARKFEVFASYLLFKQVLDDPLGRLYRAGEFDTGGIRRTVWLRVFDPRTVPFDEMVAAFDRARNIASAVASANVAAGVDCVADNNAPAFACDWIASQPLSAVFRRVADEQFPIPVDNALLIVEKIALALSAALTVEIDGGRIVHGFLHPGLIFVSNDGEGVVSGFGFGDQLLGLIDDEDSKSLVHPYIAPEALVTRTASRQGDVYSVGAILFQLLSGSALPAAPEKRAQAIADARLASDDEPLPEDIRALLQRALAGRPEERFSSASDLKKELDRLLYGGAYSPTTFNLALFMDRLFRSDIELEEAERAEEMAIDMSPYLAPLIEPTPELAAEIDTGAGAMGRNRKSLWIGLGAAGTVVVALAITLFTLTRGPQAPALPPTPTAAEMAALRQGQEDQMRELAQSLVAEMMAEKEQEIRNELLDRQSKIEELQKKLQASERRATQGRSTTEDQRRREELQQQIAAEEEAQRLKEAELEAERLRVEEETRLQAAAHQTATAVVEEESRLAAAVTPTPVPAAPTLVPTPAPTTLSESSAPVTDAHVVDISELDSLPVVIKEQKVEWPRAARFSKRQGVVIVQATVTADGAVEDVTVLRADDDEFGIPEAVVEAVMRYRFKPGIRDGVPVTTHATVTKGYRFVVR